MSSIIQYTKNKVLREAKRRLMRQKGLLSDRIIGLMVDVIQLDAVAQLGAYKCAILRPNSLLATTGYVGFAGFDHLIGDLYSKGQQLGR